MITDSGRRVESMNELADQASRFVERMKASPSKASEYSVEAAAWVAENVEAIELLLREAERSNKEIAKLKNENGELRKSCDTFQQITRDLKIRGDVLRSFAEEVADHGIRIDHTPTRRYDHDALTECAWWSTYTTKAVQRLRDEANRVLRESARF